MVLVNKALGHFSGEGTAAAYLSAYFTIFCSVAGSRPSF